MMFRPWTSTLAGILPARPGAAPGNAAILAVCVTVTRTVKEEQRVFHQCGDLSLAQPACAVAGVFIHNDALAQCHSGLGIGGEVFAPA